MNKQEMIKEMTVEQSYEGEREFCKILPFTQIYEEQVKPKLRDDSMLIHLDEVFSNCETIDNPDDIAEGDYELKESWYTYNDGGNYLERDITIDFYADDAECIGYAFISVHIGNDARWGFTDKFIVKSNYSDIWSVIEDMDANGYELDFGEIDGVTYWGYVRSVTDNYITLSKSLDNYETTLHMDEMHVDLYSLEDAIESIKEIEKEFGNDWWTED